MIRILYPIPSTSISSAWTLILIALFLLYAVSTHAAENTVVVTEPSPFAIPATDEGLPGAGPVRRAPWFQNLWQSRRSAWAENLELDQSAVIFLGDSIMQGWGGALGAAFPGMKVANRGISGDTSRGVLIRLQEDVLALNPTGIVLLIGTNDLAEMATEEVIAGNVQLMMEAFTAFDPNMPVIVCEVFPSSVTMDRPTHKIQKLNSLYRDLLSQYSQVKVLPSFALFDNGVGDASLEEFPDLLHPNEVGYAKWAVMLRPALQELGLMP